MVRVNQMSWLTEEAKLELLSLDPSLTCAIPAPICPPPMIVTFLITTFLTAEEEKCLQSCRVKKAMVSVTLQAGLQ